MVKICFKTDELLDKEPKNLEFKKMAPDDTS